ncbi:MAG: acetolactate synthase AlsS [Planctomycetota bacterium]
MEPAPTTAQQLVRLLEGLGVRYVFGIPGAKIDSVFNALLDSKIKLVLCRHEQNAAFMAAAMGRMTGRFGVVIATSGPGIGNLVTGLATATSEGDPVVAIGGEAALEDRSKSTHQSMDSVSMMRPVTKYAAEVTTPQQLGELLGEAIRAAELGRPGASFLALPKDVGLAPYPVDARLTFGREVIDGPGHPASIAEAAAVINRSKRPALLLGMQASDPRVAASVAAFVSETGIPYVSTFQGPGAWVGDRSGGMFAGRVGLFRNQPGDALIENSDCVIAVGYEPVEYDPGLWNGDPDRPIVVIDAVPARQDRKFLPCAEVVGAIGLSLDALRAQLSPAVDPSHRALAGKASAEIAATIAGGASKGGSPIHPLRIIHELRRVVTSETTIPIDVGSNYIWMNRYFLSSFPRQVLVSNGQQTLGVGLPWAIAATLARPGKPVISISGDGGFMFSSMELETAVRIGARFVHLVWDSGSYDMVAFQEQAHYGRQAGVALGRVDIAKFAEAFGARGANVTDASQLAAALDEGLASPVPFIIGVPVDYSGNAELMRSASPKGLN